MKLLWLFGGNFLEHCFGIDTKSMLGVVCCQRSGSGWRTRQNTLSAVIRHHLGYPGYYWPFVRGIHWLPVDSPHKVSIISSCQALGDQLDFSYGSPNRSQSQASVNNTLRSVYNSSQLGDIRNEPWKQRQSFWHVKNILTIAHGLIFS